MTHIYKPHRRTGHRGSSPGVRRPGRGDDHLHPSSKRVNEYSPSVPAWLVRWNL